VNPIISSWCWARDYYAGIFHLHHTPAKVAALGYNQVELNDFMLPPPRFSRIIRPLLQAIPTLPPDLWRYRIASLRQLREELDRHAVQCVCWTLNTDFTKPLWSQRLYWQWGIRAANVVGASKIRIILGGKATTDFTHHAPRITQNCRHFIQQCHKIAPHLDIVLENHWGISTDIEQHMAIFLAVREQLTPVQQAKFGLCLDPVNMPASAHRPTNWQTMLPHTTHLHLKPSLSAPETATLWQQVAQADYDGSIVFECDGDLWGADGIQQCEKLLPQ
jgi:sugar phosphate isomerase/epimerase